MTIKIVDEGPDPSVVKEVVCRNCGVKLSYTPNDVKLKVYRDYDGGSDSYKYIKCLKCNNTIVLK